MRQKICYRLLPQLGNIRDLFTDSENNDIAKIEEKNSLFFVEYNYLTCPCSGGIHRSLAEAMKEVKRLRPSAYSVYSATLP